MPDLFQLSNRLGSAKCAADLVPPSAVARTGEQAITIEGGGETLSLQTPTSAFILSVFHILLWKKNKFCLIFL